MDILKHSIRFGAILCGLAVVTGTFAAHGVDRILVEKYDGTKTVAGAEFPASWKYLQDFKTGAEYQMTHGLALIAVGLVASRYARPGLKIAAWSFLLGTILFSGALYVLVLTGQRWFGMVAPVGGILLIIGWASFAFCSATVLCTTTARGSSANGDG